MRSYTLLMCVVALMTACSSQAMTIASTPTLPGVPRATTAASVTPDSSTSTTLPTAEPSSTLAAPTDAPTNVFIQSQPPAASAAALALPPPLVVADQAAALLPDLAGDLANADRWDRYSISIALNPAGPSYQGSMRLEVTNRTQATWRELYLHLYPNHPDYDGLLRVDDVRVNDRSVHTTGEQGNVLLRVPLAQPLVAGGHVTVTMQFSGRSPRNASRSGYGAYNQEAGVWALSTFQPILASYLANGWDRRVVSSRGDFTVSDTALYDVRISAPQGWTLVTTGAQVSPAAPDTTATEQHFVSGPQREFLITALQGLEQASTTVDGTRITSYYQPANAASGQLALHTAEQALHIYNDRFGRYPLAELDVVEAALSTFLGVEYPGIVLIEQNLYKRGNGLETTVAHEVGHQWWYSQVGNDVQGQPWLDEGLTSFTQIVYREGIGDAAGAASELNGFRAAVVRARAAGHDGVIDRSAAASNNYFVLAYAKPALFFQALRNKLGDDVFYTFLQSYYSTYRYDEATGRGMLDIAQQTCSCDLQSFYNDWITSSKPVALP